MASSCSARRVNFINENDIQQFMDDLESDYDESEDLSESG